MKRFTQLEVDITRGLLKGVSRGALAGAVLSVATGAAVVTAPVAGVMVVNTVVLANWAAVGSVAGGIVGGAEAWMKHRKLEKEFGAVFVRQVPA